MEPLETHLDPSSKEFKQNRDRLQSLVDAIMGGEQAAGVPTTVKRGQLAREGPKLSTEEERLITDPVLQKYETQGSPYFSTARLWDDGVIDPAETRVYLELGLSIAYNAPIHEPRFGVFRM